MAQPDDTLQIIARYLPAITKVNPELAASLGRFYVEFPPLYNRFQQKFQELELRIVQSGATNKETLEANQEIVDLNKEARELAKELFELPFDVAGKFGLEKLLDIIDLLGDVFGGSKVSSKGIAIDVVHFALGELVGQAIEDFMDGVWDVIAYDELPPYEQGSDIGEIYIGHSEGGRIELKDGNDIFLPNATNDPYDVRGGEGNDLILGSQNNNGFYHGDDSGNTVVGGDDTIIASNGVQGMYGNGGNDWLQVEGEGYYPAPQVGNPLHGNNGSDTLIGGAYKDSLFGTDAPRDISNIKSAPASDINYLIGRGGGDVVNGGIGRDYLIGDNFADSRGEMQNTLFADFIDSVGSKIESSGNAGNDIMIGYAGDDVMAGGGGDDILWGDDSETQPLGLEGGRDILFGDAGLDQLHGGDGIDKLFGGAGSDVLRGGDDIDLLSGGGAPAGGIDLLYGGGDADIFEFNNKSILMDASAEDFIAFAGGTKQITGGVQQFWMEGGWAYYSPFSAILSAGGGMGLLSDLLYAASVLTDLRTGAHFRFGLTESDQLLMQIGRGRAGVMVLNNYDLDLEEATATGNVVAYQVDYREGKSATLAPSDPLRFTLPPLTSLHQKSLNFLLRSVNEAVCS